MFWQQMSCTQQPYSQLTRRGKHKIFIGMAPGVGETYTMLYEAQRLRQQGTDVVIGILETHGRPETAAKAQSETLATPSSPAIPSPESYSVRSSILALIITSAIALGVIGFMGYQQLERYRIRRHTLKLERMWRRPDGKQAHQKDTN